MNLNESLNSDLDYLTKWLEGNKLYLNVVKTLAMAIGYRPNIKKISEKAVWLRLSPLVIRILLL